MPVLGYGPCGMVAPGVPLESFVASDGSALVYRRFPAGSSRPRANLVHLHGIQSHGGWYVETAAELARRGYAVHLLDRRGSGSNAGPRGHIRSWGQLVEDLERFFESVLGAEPEVPTVLVGGCWGAKVAVAFALRHQDALRGLALVCPGLRVRVDLSVRHKLAVVLGRLVAPRWPIPVPLTPAMFTRDPTYLEFITQDPLSLRHVTARLFYETFWLDRVVTTQQSRLTLPLLVMQASPDPIVDEDGLRRWFEGAGSRDKRYRTYPGFDHILDFAPGRRRYWDDLDGWLGDILAPRTEAARQAVSS